MNSHKGEPLKITGEIPVSLNLLAVVHGLSIDYMKLKGLFYVLIGLTWVLFHSPSREAGLAWSNMLSSDLVGSIWIATGAIAIGTAYFGSHSARRVGFFALIVTPTLLGFYFMISWVAYMLPFIQVTGYQRGGVNTASYWAYSVSAYVMARIYTFTSGGVELDTKAVGG